MYIIKISIKLYKLGIIKAELYPELAPKTVENFLNLVNRKYYSMKLINHICKGYYIEGGGVNTNYVYEPTTPIIGEFFHNGFYNPISHTKGTLTMARNNDPNSASNSFIILGEDMHEIMDGYYAAFGRIYEGYEVINGLIYNDIIDESLNPIIEEINIIEDVKSDNKNNIILNFG